jgi:hypothetical protein
MNPRIKPSRNGDQLLNNSTLTLINLQEFLQE